MLTVLERRYYYTYFTDKVAKTQERYSHPERSHNLKMSKSGPQPPTVSLVHSSLGPHGLFLLNMSQTHLPL